MSFEIVLMLRKPALQNRAAIREVGEEQAKDDATDAFACEPGPTRALLSTRPYQPNQSLSR
jgi:hypothetical protein